MKACPMYVDRAHTHAAVEAVSAVAAVEQQPEGWRFVPDTILPGYQWAPQWVPARTPTVHWGPISGKAVGGPNTVQHSRSQCEKHPKHFHFFKIFHFSVFFFFWCSIRVPWRDRVKRRQPHGCHEPSRKNGCESLCIGCAHVKRVFGRVFRCDGTCRVLHR